MDIQNHQIRRKGSGPLHGLLSVLRLRHFITAGLQGMSQQVAVVQNIVRNEDTSTEAGLVVIYGTSGYRAVHEASVGYTAGAILCRMDHTFRGSVDYTLSGRVK
jgi:hypothetical protein